MKYIKKFNEITINDVPLVGGKNASLGQMIKNLSTLAINVPNGFAITTDGYWHYLNHNNLVPLLKKNMAELTTIEDNQLLKKVGLSLRTLILSGSMPEDLIQEITLAYTDLSDDYQQKTCDVAVRSSATAEDLPSASFAGQHDTFLHINGITPLIEAIKKCMASLFTDRAIVYRKQHSYDDFKVALSVGVQKMVRSDLASAGVAFSLETETGNKNIVTIESSYGLGETIVQGAVTPDLFLIHKPTLAQQYTPIIQKKIGNKSVKMVYHDDGSLITKPVPIEQQSIFSLDTPDIITIAQATIAIEKYYSEKNRTWTPVDIEWAKDGNDGCISIIQARPETVHSTKKTTPTITTYHLSFTDSPPLLTTGQSIGQRISAGKAHLIAEVSSIEQVQPGDIIITEMTNPDWLPVMKKAGGIITVRGGRTCHAAIVSRELNIPAIVGVQDAFTAIKNGQKITIDCSQGNTGFIYAGHIPFKTTTYTIDPNIPAPVSLMLNIADPASAFHVATLPTDGVGLTRIEFIIANLIQIHPLALLHPEKIIDITEQNNIKKITTAYKNGVEFFIDTLAQSIATIAAAFYPRPVIVRFSDFKSNEYRHLIGGAYFEPHEENPMLGLRGASRYTHDLYKKAFALECEAIKRVRLTMGLENVKIMVPFIRTNKEATLVLQELAQNGLIRSQHNLEIVMMCELPSNVLLIDEFSTLFGSFSIGSNDLTQCTLGIDRDSSLLAPLFDEQNPAIKKMLSMAITGAHRAHKKIGICGQAPSDFPALATFLIKTGIDYLSLNPDAILPFLNHYQKSSLGKKSS